jgi:phosphatidylserine/phosphatidylglycerophosphate/cardiolipin synthase-like enzyme
MRSCEKGFMPCGNNDKQKDIILNFAYNHGKIITVDNKTLMVGGHNLWGQDYLQKKPVNDLSIKISGPIAIGATKYANTMWDYTCKNHGFLSNLFYSYKNGKYSTTCLPDISTEQKLTSQKSGDIQVSAMSVSKLNNGVLGDDADQSEIARVYAFNSATKSIKISQQALFQIGIGDYIRRPILHPIMTKDGTVMQALANAITKGVSVYIVTSSLGGTEYTSYVDLKYIRNYMSNLLISKHNLTPKQVAHILNKNLHLGVISYDGNEMHDQSHNKVWIVDDHIFYNGSHNIYPSSLQQFGVIIDSKAATKLLEDKLWNPLWENSLKYTP